MRATLPIELPDPEWIEILRSEVQSGRTIADVARQIGMPRPSLSLLLSGNYPAKMDKKARLYAHKVVALYCNQVLCPHLGKGITQDACKAFAAAPMSISDPAKMRHYRACRSCPRNPENAQEVKDAV